MPIPKPKPREKEEAYIGRCMSAIGGEYDDRDQALAVCYSTYREAKKSMTVHDALLNEIRNRKAITEFNYGILTADRYVKSMQQMCGDETCYRYISAKNRNVGLDDAIKLASKKLTYSNPDMVVEDIYTDFKAKTADLGLGDDFELPKNTLMVFRHILTTPKKDRDGDIMRTQGAKPDPKMILLWNHVHTLPIGKMLAVVNHNNKMLEVISAIVDMNDLSHDAAVMIDNKMGRFSHGFKATEFTKIKSVQQMDDLEQLLDVKFSDAEREKAKAGKATGFDVTDFEIMEESMVTVPSNTDAEVTDVYLSLLDGKQLTSRMMKSYGETLRNGIAKKFPVDIDLKVSVNGKSISNDEGDDEPGSEKGEDGGCSCGGVGAPDEKRKPKAAKEEQAETDGKEMMCPECGGKIKDGVCQKCGYKMDSKKEDEEKETEVEVKEVEMLDEKSGRVLSKSNYDKLVSVRDDMDEMHNSQLITTRSGMALCKSCMTKLTEVIDSAKMDSYGGDVDKEVELTTKDAMAHFLHKADESEQERMLGALTALKALRAREGKEKTLRKFLGVS